MKTTTEKECPQCHAHNVSDDWVYVCQCCGQETCPDCAGRCGCPQEDFPWLECLDEPAKKLGNAIEEKVLEHFLKKT